MTIKAINNPTGETRQIFSGQSTNHQPTAPDIDPEGSAQDFVVDVLAVIATLLPSLTPALADQAAAAIRDRWGGDRPYISRKAGQGHSIRNAKIVRDYLAGERFELLERRYGLTRRHIIRICKS